MRKILRNHAYTGTAYGNQCQTVPARRRHPLVGRARRPAGATSYRQRPPEEWIGDPRPGHRHQRGVRRRRRRGWRATRPGRRARPRASTSSAGWSAAAAAAWPTACRTTRGYVYYQLLGQGHARSMRGRPNGCARAQHPRPRAWTRRSGRISAPLLRDPAVLDEALRRAQAGWLDEGAVAPRRQGLRQRGQQLARQVQRLIDAYAAEASPWRSSRCGGRRWSSAWTPCAGRSRTSRRP